MFLIKMHLIDRPNDLYSMVNTKMWDSYMTFFTLAEKLQYECNKNDNNMDYRPENIA